MPFMQEFKSYGGFWLFLGFFLEYKHLDCINAVTSMLYLPGGILSLKLCPINGCMYNPDNETQNLSLCRSQLVDDTQLNEPTNQNSIIVPKVVQSNNHANNQQDNFTCIKSILAVNDERTDPNYREALLFKKRWHSLLQHINACHRVGSNQFQSDHIQREKNEGSAAATKSQIILESGIVIFG